MSIETWAERMERGAAVLFHKDLVDLADDDSVDELLDELIADLEDPEIAASIRVQPAAGERMDAKDALWLLRAQGMTAGELRRSIRNTLAAIAEETNDEGGRHGSE
jgi:hypothetical protein